MDAKARAFAEEAILALGRGDSASARTFISQAVDVDHDLGPLADCVYLACAEIDQDGEVTTATWNALADAATDLWAVIEGIRS